MDREIMRDGETVLGARAPTARHLTINDDSDGSSVKRKPPVRCNLGNYAVFFVGIMAAAGIAVGVVALQEVLALQSQVDALTQQLNDCRSNVVSTTSSMTKMNVTLGDLREETQSSLGAMSNQISDMQSSLNQGLAIVTNAQQSIEAVAAATALNIAAISNSTIAELDYGLSLATNITGRFATIAELSVANATISSLVSSVTYLSSLAPLLARAADLHATAAALNVANATVNELVSSVDSLVSSVDSLSLLTPLLARTAALNATNAQLHALSAGFDLLSSNVSAVQASLNAILPNFQVACGSIAVTKGVGDYIVTLPFPESSAGVAKFVVFGYSGQYGSSSTCDVLILNDMRPFVTTPPVADNYNVNYLSIECEPLDGANDSGPNPGDVNQLQVHIEYADTAAPSVFWAVLYLNGQYV